MAKRRREKKEKPSKAKRLESLQEKRKKTFLAWLIVLEKINEIEEIISFTIEEMKKHEELPEEFDFKEFITKTKEEIELDGYKKETKIIFEKIFKFIEKRFLFGAKNSSLEKEYGYIINIADHVPVEIKYDDLKEIKKFEEIDRLFLFGTICRKIINFFPQKKKKQK